MAIYENSGFPKTRGFAISELSSLSNDRETTAECTASPTCHEACSSLPLTAACCPPSPESPHGDAPSETPCKFTACEQNAQ